MNTTPLTKTEIACFVAAIVYMLLLTAVFAAFMLTDPISY